jgi:hypothetical protein
MSVKWRVLIGIFLCWIGTTFWLGDGKRYCNDGSTTNSSARGTCSWHGGQGTQPALKILNRVFFASLTAWGYFSFFHGQQRHKRQSSQPAQPVAVRPQLNQAATNPRNGLRFQPLPASTSPPPICPLCATSMKLRVAGKGRHNGESFWGCGRYPKCKVVVPCINPETSHVSVANQNDA